MIIQKSLQKDITTLVKAIVREPQNILILGKSGYGKTTLAKYIATNSFKEYKYSVGDHKIDYNADIVIIDEVHNAKPEDIYYYMDLHDRTIIILTTELGLLPEPLVNRCIQLQIKEYSSDELLLISKEYSRHMNLNNDALSLIIERCRNTPRIIENTLKRIKLYQRTGEYIYSREYLESLLDTFGLYEGGYTYLDLEYLRILEKLGGTASLITICSILHQSKETITKYVEPFLLEKGNIIITGKGRKLC